MNCSPDAHEPLIGDPRRQAPDLHRGIVFQLWRSVEAWIELSENDILYLEGAEDFDVVGRDVATVVQTKAAAANITLRSESVVQAMVNFWQVSSNHINKYIYFRYVTTASIGVESGNPLGAGISGIKLWQKCKYDKDAISISILQNFLVSDNSIFSKLSELSPSLLNFLKRATPQEVLDRLIIPISWEVESVDEDLVRESIGIMLRAYGERLGFRPHESMVALDRLYRVVAETAKKSSDRFLSRDRFRTEFEVATSRVSSMTEIAAMRSGAIALQQSFAPAGSDDLAIIPGLSPIQCAVPAVSEMTINRTPLVEDIVTELKNLGTVIIEGSSGMGKSTIAKLAASRIGGSWVWLDMQDVPAVNVPAVIRGLASVLVEVSTINNIGLDNLNFSLSDLSVVELTLPAIFRIARNRGGVILITTQRSLPIRILKKMSIVAANVKKIPYLDEKEIEEFAKLLGCPVDHSLNILAKFVSLQTSGHPRLVHARLVGQLMEGWPCPKADELLVPQKEIVEEREVARQLLDGAPVGDKELLYRLSVAVGPFRKDHAILVGQAHPSLEYPADSFVRLAGPWIDSLGEGYYRISPLLQNSAAENWSKDKVNSARRALARSMVSSKDKTLLEANEILFQGILSQDEESVTSVTIGLQSVPAESMKVVAEKLGWLTLLGRSPESKLFDKNDHLNFFLRLLQFRILAEQPTGDVDGLCHLIDAEFSHFEERGEMRDTMRVSWLMMAVIYFHAKINPALLVSYWGELYELFPQTSIFEDIKKSLNGGSKLSPNVGSDDFHSQCMIMVLAREMDSSRLVDLARAINDLPDLARSVALLDMKNLLFPLRLAVDRAWTCELKNEERNWTAVLSNYEKFVEEVKGWDAPDLLIFVARAMAAIEDEYCDNGEKAALILKEARDLSASQIHFLDDQRAMVLSNAGELAQAVAIWKEILPNWPCDKETPDHAPLYACERAGSAAAKILDWEAAIMFFAHGQYLGGFFDEILYVISYFVDEAFAVWKSGERRLALDRFAEALRRLEGLDVSRLDESHIHRIRKCFEQIVKWCRVEAGFKDMEQAWEPPVGFCSSLSISEKIGEIAASPYDLQWHFLAEIEMGIRGAGAIFDHAIERASRSKFAGVRIFSLKLQLNVAFRRRDFSNMVQLGYDLSQALADGEAHVKAGKNVLQVDDFTQKNVANSLKTIEDAVISALLVLASDGKPLDLFFSQWTISADRIADQPDIASFLLKLGIVLNMPMREFIAVNQNSDEYFPIRLGAALLMSDNLQVSLVGMIIGQASLLDFVERSLFKADVEQELAILIRNQWYRRIKFPPALLLPYLTIPAIKSACEKDAKGVKLAASILLEARLAVQFCWPSDVLDGWRKLAGD